jgi:hypothetical protein
MTANAVNILRDYTKLLVERIDLCSAALKKCSSAQIVSSKSCTSEPAQSALAFGYGTQYARGRCDALYDRI